MKRAQLRNAMLIVIVLGATASVFVAPSAYATDSMWSGGTSTDWALAGNWTGGAPGNTDNAVFDGTAVTNQPNLAASATVGGVWMTGTPGQSNTISLSAGTDLSINGNTINSIAGLGILVDNSNAQTLTISAPVTLGAAQTWRNSSGNLLTVSGALNTNSQALTIDGTGNTTVGGAIVGGRLSLAGTGNVVTFSGANTFGGQLTVKSGTLSIPTINNTGANGPLGNSALPVILGDAGSTGTLHFTGASGSSSSKKFTLATGGTGVIQLEDPTTLTLSGVIDGDGALVLTSSPTSLPSTLTLSGINTYSGGTTVYAGTLFGTNDASFGTGKVTFDTPAGAGGQLRNSGAPRTWTNDFFLAANSIVPVRSNSVTNKITLSGPLTGTGTLVGNTINSGYLVMLGDISGFQGTFTQNSTNNTSLGISFEGTTAENQDGSQAHLILSGVTSGFNNNTTVRFGATGRTTKFGELAGTGGVMLAGTSAGPITLEVGNLVTGVNSSTFAGSILNSAQNNTTNPVSFRKVGSGALVLSGTNAYDGSTTVSAGTLVVGADAPTSSTNISHTAVSAANATETFTLTNHGLVNGNRVLIGATTIPSGVAATTVYYVRDVTANTFRLSTAADLSSLVSFTTNGAGVIATRATALGADNGAVVLNDGGTAISNSDVNLATGGAFTIQRAVTVANQGTGVTAIGGLTDNNSTFSGLVTVNKNLTVGQFATTGSNALHVTGGITSGGSNQTITFGKTGFLGAVNVETTGISDGSGTLAVNVEGNTTTIAANSTYTGNTTISNGTLALGATGSINNTPVISVATGATFDVSAVSGYTLGGSAAQTLKGTGTVTGSVTLGSLGTISPGTSPGTLTVDALTVNNGATAAFDLDRTNPSSTSDDLLVVNNAVNFSATTLNLVFTSAAFGGGAFSTPGSWLLVDAASLTGTPPTTINYSFVEGLSGVAASLDVNGVTGNISLVLTAAGGVAGDYNGNGVVDAADYVVWRKNKGLTGSPTASQGNGNGDGIVDDLDYDYWKARFGNTSGSGSSLTGGGTVPEPSFALLACSGIILLSSVRRGRFAHSR